MRLAVTVLLTSCVCGALAVVYTVYVLLTTYTEQADSALGFNVFLSVAALGVAAMAASDIRTIWRKR